MTNSGGGEWSPKNSDNSLEASLCGADESVRFVGELNGLGPGLRGVVDESGNLSEVLEDLRPALEDGERAPFAGGVRRGRDDSC